MVLQTTSLTINLWVLFKWILSRDENRRLKEVKIKKGLRNVMFFSAYCSDIQGGKEIKGPGIKAKIILLLL